MVTIHNLKDYLHLIINKKRRIIYRIHKYGKIEKLELMIKSINDVIKMIRNCYHNDPNGYISIYANGAYQIIMDNKEIDNVFNDILGGMQ